MEHGLANPGQWPLTRKASPDLPGRSQRLRPVCVPTRQAGQKVAGRVKFDDITPEKGVLQDGSDQAALDWIKELVDLSACGTHRQA